MGDGNLHYASACHFDFLDKLHANCPAGTAQLNPIKSGLADQSEVAINILKTNAKYQTGELVVDLPNPNAMEWIMTLGFDSIHQPNIGTAEL